MLDLGCRDHGPDLDRVGTAADAAQFRNRCKIHQPLRPDFARLHRRQQRVTASKQRGLRIHGQDLHQGRKTVRLTILEFVTVHAWPC